MDWFQDTKKNLKRPKLLKWLQLTLPVPAGILTAQLMARVVSCAVDGNAGRAGVLGLSILCIKAAEKLAAVLITVRYEKTASAALHQCKMELYRLCLSNPPELLFSLNHGAAAERINDDFDHYTEKELSVFPSVMTGLMTTAAYFAYLSLKNPILALILSGISVLQVIPPLIVKRFLQINYDSNREIEEALSDFTAEGYHGFATIKLYHLEEWWLDRLKALHRRYLKIGNRCEATYSAERILKLTVENILKYGTCAIVGLLILSGHTAMQDGIAAIALSAGFYAAVSTITGEISRLSLARAARLRLAQWTSAAPTNPGTEPLRPADNTADDRLVNGSICVSRLKLPYEEAAMTGEINAAFSGDDISVIKGQNGIGKSSLFRIITGLVLPESGSVQIDGKSPQTLAAAQFPYAICYLPQEDPAFGLTAMELYHMLLPGTDEAIRTAMDFGLTEASVRDTRIRELSGGERKKVFLSLALSLNPRILLLDEPTNSLDTPGKDTLKRRLLQRCGSTLLITHENIFDDIADKIYLLNQKGMVQLT